MKSIRQKISILFNNPLFEHFSTLERFDFIKLCHKRTYRQGEIIYHQGDPAVGIYFIEEGKVSLTIQNVDPSAEPLLFELIKPDSFGLITPGYASRREATATCETDCVIYGFFQPDYETLKKRHPKVAASFLESISRSIARLNDHLSDSLKTQVGELESQKILLSGLRQVQ